jgi:DNA-binding transcriptional LysR family regulator
MAASTKVAGYVSALPSEAAFPEGPYLREGAADVDLAEPCRGVAMATIDQMDIRDLQCVVTLAETLNFTETANRLNTTQPAITIRINKVERNHGYKLFERSKGLVKAITPEGFIFVEEAKQILVSLHRLITRSDAAHRAFLETLSIIRSHHADLQLLSIVVAAQAIAGTRISIQPPCNSDEETLAMLLHGKADVALVAWPVTESQVTVLHLTHDTLLAVLPEGHALRNRSEIHIADLRGEQIIGSKHQYPAVLKDAFFTKCKAFGFTPEWVCVSASPAESGHLVDTAVRPGITIVTKRHAAELALTKAICVPFVDDEIAYEYGVAYRHADHRPVLNAFLQYLVEKCNPIASGRRRKPVRSILKLNDHKATG